jgi:hypothetical protein
LNNLFRSALGLLPTTGLFGIYSRYNVSKRAASMIVRIKKWFCSLPVIMMSAKTLVLGKDLGQLNIRFPEDSPFGIVEFILLIAVTLIWYLFLLLLNRWNRKQQSFCYWFPTLMLFAIAVMVRILDRIDSATPLGKVLGCLAFLIAWINFPFLIGSSVLGVVWLEVIPVWIRLTLAGLVFWALWYLVLRHMRRRSSKNTLVALHLLNNTDRSDRP